MMGDAVIVGLAMKWGSDGTCTQGNYELYAV